MSVPGLDSGFASDLADTTDGAGHFSIANVPFHTYPRCSSRRRRLRAGAASNRPVTRDLSVERQDGPRLGVDRGRSEGREVHPARLRSVRLWPEQMLDLNLGTGWGSDAVGSTSGSHVKGPRKVVIKLPKVVDITSVRGGLDRRMRRRTRGGREEVQGRDQDGRRQLDHGVRGHRRRATASR